MRNIFKGSSRISHFSCIPSLSPFHILKSYIYSSSPACQPNSDDESSSVGRPRIRVQDILSSKADTPFTIPKSTKLDDAISFLVKHRLSCCLALDKDGTVAGVFTARDVLRFMDKVGTEDHAGKASAFKKTIADLMTKKDKLVYCAPHDTVRKCREIMFQLKIRNMPVIDQGEVYGIVTIKDLADSAFSVTDTGGKKGFIHNVTGRKGLPEGTKLSEGAQRNTASSARAQMVLDFDVGSYALPHPYKTSDNVSSSRRQYGASELSNDLSLCEDAHFTISLPSNKGGANQVYLCVADGVGSWRQHGVDPRQFAHRLVENARQTIELNAQLLGDTDVGAMLGLGGDTEPVHPLDVIIEAWNATTHEEVTGSSTICVATLDSKLNQLSYSNLGDCGLVVVRHIDSETAGYMRERQLPRHMRKNDLRIAYLSQQQIKSFNRPYQLGFSNLPGHNWVGDSPQDADTASIPIMAGDIVIMATDGLFDNLDLDEIVDEVSEWEEIWFRNAGLEISSSHPNGGEAMQALAEKLVKKAREFSLDTQRDSPFAVLAKENDIMWGGGMPDDTSVVVMRTIKRS